LNATWPLKVLNALLLILYLPMAPFLWLFCRLTAQRCPTCGSTWRTEMVGEWDGEDWKCHKCGQFWTV
jgi:hypothetical protein